eukprot:gnl/TRDRNA2_/TRDRNA2_166995_c0_seq1.p1 gnl/TRDRNA2_/TRDRNA2_166995_c0~~gnl/TRDRNA2_/TRDRNA2_166995_c0_seq1.p1  ORF type:complete len:688 (+),score=93.15 gnl/TRDRNA2_/TRDRNA2_166995_c0_seq1:193-2064(+)
MHDAARDVGAVDSRARQWNSIGSDCTPSDVGAVVPSQQGDPFERAHQAYSRAIAAVKQPYPDLSALAPSHPDDDDVDTTKPPPGVTPAAPAYHCGAATSQQQVSMERIGEDEEGDEQSLQVTYINAVGPPPEVAAAIQAAAVKPEPAPEVVLVGKIPEGPVVVAADTPKTKVLCLNADLGRPPSKSAAASTELIRPPCKPAAATTAPLPGPAMPTPHAKASPQPPAARAINVAVEVAKPHEPVAAAPRQDQAGSVRMEAAKPHEPVAPAPRQHQAGSVRMPVSQQFVPYAGTPAYEGAYVPVAQVSSVQQQASAGPGVAVARAGTAGAYQPSIYGHDGVVLHGGAQGARPQVSDAASLGYASGEALPSFDGVPGAANSMSLGRDANAPLPTFDAAYSRSGASLASPRNSSSRSCGTPANAALPTFDAAYCRTATASTARGGTPATVAEVAPAHRAAKIELPSFGSNDSRQSAYLGIHNAKMPSAKSWEQAEAWERLTEHKPTWEPPRHLRPDGRPVTSQAAEPSPLRPPQPQRPHMCSHPLDHQLELEDEGFERISGIAMAMPAMQSPRAGAGARAERPLPSFPMPTGAPTAARGGHDKFVAQSSNHVHSGPERLMTGPPPRK